MSKQMFESGTRVGHFTLLYRFRKNGRAYWHCKCDCGNEKDIREDAINSGRTISCGCVQKKTQFKKAVNPMREHPEYHVANGIFQRCFNPKNCNYSCYGERGITVNLDEFPDKRALADYILELRIAANDVEERKLSIDRIDCNGNYEKSNMRLVDNKTQSNNTRTNLHVEYCGKSYTLTVACEMLGISRMAVYKRMYRYNLTPQEAFNYYL